MFSTLILLFWYIFFLKYLPCFWLEQITTPCAMRAKFQSQTKWRTLLWSLLIFHTKNCRKKNELKHHNYNAKRRKWTCCMFDWMMTVFWCSFWWQKLKKSWPKEIFNDQTVDWVCVLGKSKSRAIFYF